jgi:hypothetical protein
MAKFVGLLVRRLLIFSLCPVSLGVNKLETRRELKIVPLRCNSMRARLLAMRYNYLEVEALIGRL